LSIENAWLKRKVNVLCGGLMHGGENYSESSGRGNVLKKRSKDSRH
jgi:hypothetical protein